MNKHLPVITVLLVLKILFIMFNFYIRGYNQLQSMPISEKKQGGGFYWRKYGKYFLGLVCRYPGLMFYCVFYQVRQQHEERNIGFLVDEIKVMDIFEAKNRVFFISAKEVLAKRSHDERGTPIGEKAPNVHLSYCTILMHSCLGIPVMFAYAICQLILPSTAQQSMEQYVSVIKCK